MRMIFSKLRNATMTAQSKLCAFVHLLQLLSLTKFYIIIFVPSVILQGSSLPQLPSEIGGGVFCLVVNPWFLSRRSSGVYLISVDGTMPTPVRYIYLLLLVWLTTSCCLQENPTTSCLYVPNEPLMHVFSSFCKPC